MASFSGAARDTAEKKGKTYTWTLQGTQCICLSSTSDDCSVIKLWEFEEPKPFHDKPLMDATSEINGLLESAAKRNHDPERGLSFISFEGRLFLVWTRRHHGLIAEDDPQVVADALGLLLDEPASESIS
jgi:hypothetical protein